MGKSQRSQLVIDTATGVVTKRFVDSPLAAECLANERLAREVFIDAPWMTPILRHDETSITLPLYPDSARLENALPGLRRSERQYLALELLKIAFEIHRAGYAHRDFHSGNVFLVDGQIRLVDYETITRCSDDTPFPRAYDLIGVGLPSPYNTRGTCYARDHAGMLGRDLKVPLTKALALFERALMQRVADVSVTFATKRKTSGHHVRRSSRRFYSSLSSEFLVLPARQSQRDSALRLREFRVSNSEVTGRTVLDLGCHVGSLTLQFAALGASRCVGVEFDQSKIDVARDLAGFAGLAGRTEFVIGDLDDPPIGESFDIVLCLAVDGHVSDREALARFLGRSTTGTLLFEGNSGADANEIRDLLRRAGFSEITDLGMSQADVRKQNRNRPIMRASKSQDHLASRGMERRLR